MILAGFALFIIFLLVIGMPVAFTLSIAGILRIIQLSTCPPFRRCLSSRTRRWTLMS